MENIGSIMLAALIGAAIAFGFTRLGKNFDKPGEVQDKLTDKQERERNRADDKYVSKEVCSVCQEKQDIQVKRQDETLDHIKGYVESVDNRLKEMSKDVKELLLGMAKG